MAKLVWQEVQFPSPSGDYFFNKVPPAEITKYIAAEVFPSPSEDYFFNKSTVKRV